jgi:hypothetical protein
MRETRKSRSPRITSVSGIGKSSGAGCLIPFGLVFGGIGLLALILLAREFIADAKTRGWNEVPAELVRCEIQIDEAKQDAPFLLEVEYHYQFEGQTHTSTRYARKDQWTNDYEKLALQRAEFAKGDGSAACYVNPDDPTDAIMKRESQWAALFLLIPLVFVLVGGGIVWAGVAAARKKKSEAEGSVKPLSVSTKAGAGKAGPIAMGLFGLIFFSVGFGTLFPLAITPYLQAKAAATWLETPCKIIWSRVQSHEGDDSTTYSVDIFYEYVFAGVAHRSNRYSFSTGSSSGRDSKAAITKRYPRGSQQICYIDPAQPERAVLDRGLDAIGFWFLIPAAFMLFGLLAGFGALSSLWKGKKPPAPLDALRSSATSAPPNVRETAADAGPVTLNPAKSRLAGLIAVTFFALFWNGIVSVFIFSGAMKPSGGGLFGIFPILFMIPFLLIGLGLIAGVIYMALGLFNPKVELVLTPGQPCLGERASLSWRMKGSSSRLRSLKILLVGSEVATYRRGTNTHTDREPFYAQVLASETTPLAFYQGEVAFEIPYDLMYSLSTGNNRIEWEIRIVGEIKPGPDISDSSTIEIHPAASA